MPYKKEWMKERETGAITCLPRSFIRSFVSSCLPLTR